MQTGQFLAGIINLFSVRIDIDIGVSYISGNFLLPSSGIFNQSVVGDGSSVLMPVTMGSEQPPCFFQAVRDCADHLPVFFQRRTFHIIDTVAKRSFIPGSGYNAFCTPQREIRVFFYKGIQYGHHVIVPDALSAVRMDVEILHVSVFVQYQLFGKAVMFHIIIIAYIVNRQYKRDLSFRNQRLRRCQCDIAVLVSLFFCQIMNIDQYVLIRIQLFQNGMEFIYGSHPVIVSVFHVIAVKSKGSIHNQRMKENMSYRLVIWNKGVKSIRTGADGGKDFFFLREFFRNLLKQCKRFFIIIALSQFKSLFQYRSNRLLITGGSKFFFGWGRFFFLYRRFCGCRYVVGIRCSAGTQHGHKRRENKKYSFGGCFFLHNQFLNIYFI